MSRNKIILLVGALVVIYLTLPSEGIYGIIKANMISVAPYIMIGVILYLLITINLLKKALYRLTDNICEENVAPVTKLLRITFDVKRMVGTVNLQNVYKRVNSSKYISVAAKKEMYEVLRRKRIEIPLPSGGKADR